MFEYAILSQWLVYEILGQLVNQETELINPFIPEFLKWTIPPLNLDLSTDAHRGFSWKSKTEWQTV